MARWTTAFPSYSTLYSYVQVDNWTVHGDRCTFDLSGGITSPYYWNVGGISCEIGWWESGTYHTIDTDTVSYNQNGGDKVVFDFSDYFTRQAADRTVYLYHEAQASGTAYAESTAYTVPHLAPSVTWASVDPVVRNSDTSITLKWNAPALEYSAMCLEVSIDGGSWSQFAVLWNTATSYTWNGASVDHSYQFRIRSNYLASYSAYDVCNTVITMTPAAPQSISLERADATDINVTLVNESTVATALDWEVSYYNGSTWSAWATGGTSPVAGAPVTSFTASTSGGTVKLRVRNVNSQGESAWLESGSIVTITPPNPPTLNSPKGILDTALGKCTFSWTHNPKDNSAQTAYYLQYSTDGGSTWTDHTENTADQTYTLDPIPWTAGTTVTWRVKTKGADVNYGEYAASETFDVYTAPTVYFTSPGNTVTGMPISVAATYSDMAGFTCKDATLTLPNGKTKKCTINGTSITASIGVDEWLPDNGATYTVVLTARSSSSLQSTANATFDVAFIEPSAGELQVSNDPDNGYALLTATFEDQPDITYNGATNVQFDTQDGSMHNLLVNGMSKKWNQTFPNQNVSINNTTYNYQITRTGGGYFTITVNMVITADEQPNVFWYGGGYLKSGHKYLLITDSDTISALWKSYSSSVSPSIVNGTGSGTNFSFKMKNVPVGTYTVRVCSIDLTDMYGIGNEPTSIDDPRIASIKEYAFANPAYDAGSLASITNTTVDSNGTSTTITSTLRSAGSVSDELQVNGTSVEVTRNIGTRSYQSGDESDSEVLTDGTNTYYALTTPTVETLPDIAQIDIGLSTAVLTDLDSLFSMTVGGGSASAVSISVSRINTDGTITPLITDGESGAGAVDKYAPLNTTYQYAVTTMSTTHAVKTVYVDNIIESDKWFAYWTVKDGENAVDKMASAKWNPDNGGIQLARPQKTRVYYAGRKDPVSYDGAAVSLTETPSWVIVEREEAQPFVQLIEDGGRGVYKSCDGWVYHADFDLTLTPKYIAIGYYGGIGLTVTRIAGDLL